MRLSDLLQVLDGHVTIDEEDEAHLIEITHIAFHSGEIREGGLFIAVSGFQTDGHRYIENAVASGAAAVIGELPRPSELGIPYIRVANSRIALALLAAEWYGHPHKHHTMIGITGTNGKTTTAYMIRHILQQDRQTCSLFSTVEQQINNEVFPSSMTTQNPLQLMEWLTQSRDRNVVMEVSSHGLSQHRTDGIGFDLALFTNLSHDHLDYHPSLEQYYRSKKRLFSLLKPDGEAIVNTHCPWGDRLARSLRNSRIPTLTYGMSEHDDIQLLHVINGPRPVFYIAEHEEVHSIELSVPGFHNVWNAVAAVAAARRLRVDYAVITGALASFPGVPGRLETYEHPNGARFIIDYAHTPDGVLQCLTTMNVYKPKRLFHLFGFRGGRDYSKWKEMVAISRAHCHKTILTLDDLNGDSLEAMLGLYKSYADDDTLIITDRTLAIEYAWNKVGPDDCVVLTGKGPETYERTFELSTRSDAETIEFLKKRDTAALPISPHIASIEENSPAYLPSEEW